MSPFVAHHATDFRHRESIREHGLLVDCCFSFRDQPERMGVYVYREDMGHETFGRSPFSVWWDCGLGQDVWQVAYIGPMSLDMFVENGFILHDGIPPQCLTLITPITPNSREGK